MTPAAARTTRVDREVAASIDLPPSLLAHAPELLTDLDALGSSPAQVVRLLRQVGARRGSRVIDLACGKGSASISLARHLHCKCLAFDAFGPFVAAASARAASVGLGSRTLFDAADLNAFERRLPRGSAGAFDIGLMLGLWPADRAAALLRRLVRPGGLYFIDDAVWLDQRDGTTRDDITALISLRGDHVLACETVAPSVVRRRAAALHARMSRRAREISRREPHLRAELRAFLERQREAGRILSGPMRAVVWVVRRASPKVR
ncbi:MAG: class I SAM-dependent methyltransferase [Planctomycetota bacterium]|nr:class I SAM-dependent methyltransferase [Planctomycetota bacterium]